MPFRDGGTRLPLSRFPGCTAELPAPLIGGPGRVHSIFLSLGQKGTRPAGRNQAAQQRQHITSNASLPSFKQDAKPLRPPRASTTCHQQHGPSSSDQMQFPANFHRPREPVSSKPYLNGISLSEGANSGRPMLCHAFGRRKAIRAQPRRRKGLGHRGIAARLGCRTQRSVQVADWKRAQRNPSGYIRTGSADGDGAAAIAASRRRA